MYISRYAESALESWKPTSKILLLLGARQVGKTTLLKRYYKNARSSYINLDIQTDKQKLLQAMALDPKAALTYLGSPDILIIDEAQRLPDISKTVKGWYDANIETKVILSGSSSLNLLDQSAEALTGRNIKLFLPPLLFAEIISNQNWYSGLIKQNLQEGHAFSEQISTLMMSSIVFGSYPEAVLTPEKETYLTNLVSDFLLKDILQLGLVKTPETLSRLLQLLAYQVGSVVSTNEIATSLGIARITVERYLDLLEQTFVIFRLPAYSTNPRKEIAKSKKIFFWDTGISNALVGEYSLNPLRSDIGSLWENWVIAEFAKRNLSTGNINKLYFWRSRSGSEVDLVIKESTSGKIRAYEIKWSGKKLPSKSFAHKYNIPVEVVHKDNILNFIL